MKILETERTILREIIESDAEFMLDLLNQPSFIKYIGDRNVRDVEQARDFIENRYRQSYREHGFGLYTVELKAESDTFTDVSVSAFEIQNPKSSNRHLWFCETRYFARRGHRFCFFAAVLRERLRA